MWVMRLFDTTRGEVAPPVPRVDRMAVREELTRTDPDFARVRRAHHDAINALTAKGIRDGLAVRRERKFWSEHGGRRGT